MFIKLQVVKLQVKVQAMYTYMYNFILMLGIQTFIIVISGRGL